MKITTIICTILISAPLWAANPAPEPKCLSVDERQTLSIEWSDTTGTYAYTVASAYNPATKIWGYAVSQNTGSGTQNLELWSLGISMCKKHIKNLTTGAQWGQEKSANNFEGVKWKTQAQDKIFTLSLDKNYPLAEKEILLKNADHYVICLIKAPDCPLSTLGKTHYFPSPR